MYLLLLTKSRDPIETETELVFECLLWRYGSAVDCRRDRGPGCSRLGYGINPLGGGRHQPHHRAARTYRSEVK